MKKPSYARALAAPALVVSLGLASGGCASQPKPEPVVASSGGQASYAAHYPAELTALQSDFAQRQQEARAAFGAFGRYPDELHDTRWKTVKVAYAAADEAGRSSSYVDERRRLAGVQVFFADEREEIGKRVAGAAQYAAQQKGCTADVGGAAAGSLKEAIDKRIEKRLRAHNEADTVIERHRLALGKENAATLEHQTDDIANASFDVYIALVDIKVRVKAYVDESAHVRDAGGKYVAEEGKYQSEPGHTEAEKKASGERVNAMNQSLGQLDSVVARANDFLTRADNEIGAAQNDYKAAFSALVAKVDAKGGK